MSESGRLLTGPPKPGAARGWKKYEKLRKIIRDTPLYLMLLPAAAFFIIFHYQPMYGLLIAFQKYSIKLGIFGSPFVGLDNFRRMFENPDFLRAFFNTIIISLMKIAVGFPAPIIFALLLNELIHIRFKKIVQTLSYMPHFLSWVIMAGIFIKLLSPTNGIVNFLIERIGGRPIYFLADKYWFRWVLVITDVYKEIGWGSIIYLAALAGVDVELYEAAKVDGITRLRAVWSITLPSIAPTIVTMLILRMGGILNAGMDQIYLLISAPVYPVADILDTLSLRLGITGMDFPLGAAVGMIKAVLGSIFIFVTNYVSKKLVDDSGIF